MKTVTVDHLKKKKEKLFGLKGTKNVKVHSLSNAKLLDHSTSKGQDQIHDTCILIHRYFRNTLFKISFIKRS